MRPKVDQGVSRAMNRRLVLDLLRSRGAKSRAEIANVTGLSPATVSFVVADLVEERLLIEGKATVGASGRRPIPVEINYAGQLAVGLQLRVGAIDFVLTDLSTTALASSSVPLRDESPETVVDASVQAVEQFFAQIDNTRTPISGIGIGMPGIIDTVNGICRRSYRFGWYNVPIAAMLAERVHVPVWVDDDTNAFALAQQLFGVGRHHQTVGALAIGAGICCAVVIDGSVHHGANGAAGKIGHSTYDSSGPICYCGRRGCLETFFSEPALVRRWRAANTLGPEVTRHDMMKAAMQGDTTAIDLLKEAGDGIGKFLANFCNVIDPEVIVVGGEAVVFGDFLLDPMRDAVAQHSFSGRPPPITPDWTDSSWARGAAALATQQLFNFEAVSGKTRLAVARAS